MDTLAVATTARAHGYDVLLLTGEEGPVAVRRVTGSGLADAMILMDVDLGGGPPLAVLTLAVATADEYAYVTAEAPFPAEGVHDVRLRLRGPLCLAHVYFSG